MMIITQHLDNTEGLCYIIHYWRLYMARIVVEGVDEEMLSRFDAFCKIQGLSRKELLIRYMTRLVKERLNVDENGDLHIQVPAFVPKGKELLMVYVSDDDLSNDEDQVWAKNETTED
jgi:hypothetical protein